MIRARFARERAAQWLGPQEFVAAIREAALRGGLPVARARGDRGPWRINSGPALALGHLSRCEYVDIALAAPMSAADFAQRLQPSLPAGIRLLWSRRLPPGAPGVQRAVKQLCYKVSGLRWRAGAIKEFEAAASWPWVRRKQRKPKEIDLKQHVRRLSADGIHLYIDLIVRSEGLAKPHEIVSAVFGAAHAEAVLLPVERSGALLDWGAAGHAMEHL